MTTQEAKIKNDIPRKQEHNKYSELYFPDLRSTAFSIFSGDASIIEKLTKITHQSITDLHNDYLGVKEHQQAEQDLPIQIEFTDTGLTISVVIREQDPETQHQTINIIDFQTLEWNTDSVLLTALAKSMNELVLQCTRVIPKLANQRASFKMINQIETNPIYEYMVLVYSMYKMLHLADSLPGCYVQALMARKRITYNMLCHTLKYTTKLPDLAKNWFTDEDIVRKQKYTIRTDLDKTAPSSNEQTTVQSQDESYQHTEHWALHLIDYTGQKFSQKLQFTYAPKRTYVNDRYVNLDGDAAITG